MREAGNYNFFNLFVFPTALKKRGWGEERGE